MPHGVAQPPENGATKLGGENAGADGDNIATHNALRADKHTIPPDMYMHMHVYIYTCTLAFVVCGATHCNVTLTRPAGHC